MSGDGETLGAIAALFLSISLVAFGGVRSVLPEIHRQAVDVFHWLDSAQFVQLFAISQAAPGPNFMIVTLIGYRAAGVAGALVATVAAVGPTCILVYIVAKVWERFRGTLWRDVIEAGVAPVTVGLVAASAFVLSRAADTSVATLAITVVTALAASATSVNPLILFAAAAGLGFFGLL